jgi:hypothetical protein
MKTLTLLILIAFILSCSPFKERYYNKLSDKKKEKYLVNSINTDEHSKQQNDTIYSLNISELKKLIDNSNKNYHLIYSFNLNCFDLPLLTTLIEKFKEIEGLEYYVINGVDLVYKEKFMKLIYSLNSNIKYYLLDPEIYGNIEGWHENRTTRLRLRKFYFDVLNFTGYTPDDEIYVRNDEYSPTLILLDKNLNPVYSTNAFCLENQCNEKATEIVSKLNEFINKINN